MRRAALLLALALAPVLPALQAQPLDALQPWAGPAAWAQAAQGPGFVLATPAGPLRLQAVPEPLLAPGLPVPGVGLYRLEGEAWGALAVAPGWAHGFVMTPQGALPLGAPPPGPEPAEPLLLFDPPGAPEHTNCFEAIPVHLPSSPAGVLPPSQNLQNLGIHTAWPERAYQLVLDADKPFVDLGPGDWQARQLAPALQVSVLYQAYFGLRLEVVAQAADLQGTRLTSPDTTTLLRQARDHWNAQAQPREGVHVLSGRWFNVTLAPLVPLPAQVLGQSLCIGAAGDPARAYSLSSVQQPGWRLALTMAHELGHDFGAHHHYATCAGLNDPVRPCTTMFSPANVAGLGFGLVERMVVRGTAEGHGV